MTGLLFNYAAHPLSMCRENGVISADFPGRAIARLIGRGIADHAQFLQGCAGNVNVKISGDGAADRVGEALAEAVQKAASSATKSRSSDLCTGARIVPLPWGRMPAPAEINTALAEVKNGRGPARPFWWEPWAEQLMQRLQVGPSPTHAEVLIQSMKLGDAIFLALPGEVFVEIGLEIKKQAAADHVFVAGYANNGEIGYIPTREAFDQGGMEVDVSPFYYGLFQLAPGCGEILAEAALELARQTMGRQ